jgi:hypothetical protein
MDRLLTEEEKSPICSGCDHHFDKHVRSVLDNIVCTVSDAVHSNRGIVASWYNDCDCINGVSKSTNLKRARIAKEQERRNVYTDALVNAIEKGEIPELKIWEPLSQEPLWKT